MKKNLIHVLLLVILLVGGAMRFYNVNWDSFGGSHPDERNISWAVTRIHFFDQLNPKFFAYGGLPIYLYRALGEMVVGITDDPEWLMGWGHIAVIGRYVSATLSTISIFLIFLVGRSLFSPAVGLISALLLTFSPWAIREAHFATTETMLVFFILLLLYLSNKHILHNSKFKILLLGVTWGLALAAKTTSLLFGVIPVLAIWLPNPLKNIRRKLLFTLLLSATALCFFFIFSPYTILDIVHYRESMVYETGVALGRFSVPYTLQFLHTTPYLYQIRTMLWLAGPIAIIGLIGLIVMVIQMIRRFHSKFIIHYSLFIIFPFIYFGWSGSWYAKFARYNVPFLPFITIAAAWLCTMIIKRFRLTGLAFTAFLLISTFAWGLANFSVFIRPQTRMEASEWIYATIPGGAQLYTEHWNDGLPVDLPMDKSFNRETLEVYDEDTPTKKLYYADKLALGDYIILSTRRIWGTMPNLTEKYPLTSLVYRKLLSGELGYTEVATFTSYPQLLGWVINDDSAEESVQVFDHPTVRIFQNTEHWTPDEYIEFLTP